MSLFNLYKKCYLIKKHNIKNLIVIRRNNTSQAYYVQSSALPRDGQLQLHLLRVGNIC